MTDTPFIKFFPGDFLAGTSGLSPAERGVYITLLCLMWENDGPITMDLGRLARRCGVPKAGFKKILSALIDEGKIIDTEEGLFNRRAKKTLMDRQNRTQKATIAANSRWHAQDEKTEKNQGQENAGAYDKQCLGDAKPESRVQSSSGGSGSAGARELILEAIGVDPTSGLVGPSGPMLGTLADMTHAQRWTDDLGLSIEDITAVIRDVMAAKPGRAPPTTFRYFDQPMQRLAAIRQQPALSPSHGDPDAQSRNSRPGRTSAHAGGRGAHAEFLAAFVGEVPEDG